MFKVMIVDDIEFMRRELKRLKVWGEQTGFTIYDEASNGQEALKKLELNHVDLIITDIRMPVVDGLELLKKVRDNNLAHCVVLLSEHCEFGYARQGIVLGAFDYIAKPINEDEFRALLHRAGKYIEGKKLEEEMIKQLEDKVAEKIEMFFPVLYIKQVLELLKNGDSGTLQKIEDMIEATYVSLGRDIIKTSVIINKAVDEIVFKISSSYPWLNKFINIKLVQDTDLSKLNDLCQVKEISSDIIQRILKAIKLLLICGQDNELINRVCLYVLENIDSNLSLTSISENLYVNKTYLSETFKQRTGVSLVEYMTMAKLERAKKLIQDKGLKIYEISQKLGYDDNSYFSNIFKKYTGLTPTEFKQKEY